MLEALLRGPEDVLLLDEPDNYLDVPGKRWLEQRLVDTGKTARAVREMLPKAHFVTIYAKPEGRPLVDQYLTEVAQQCWIQFPWDMGIAYVEPLADQMKK